MELNNLKYFYAVAKEGSFTKASRVLRVGQPSISKMVKNIEEIYQINLFDRTKQGVVLTETGEFFYQKCSSIFREIEELESYVQSDSEQLSGTISIGASDNICNYLLPSVIGSFREKYPNIVLDFLSGTSSEIKKSIQQRDVEFGLFYTKLKDKDLVQIPISFVKFIIVYSPQNLSSKKLTLMSINQFDYIGSRKLDYYSISPVEEMLKKAKIIPKAVIQCNNQETQKRMAIVGEGYTVLPVHMVLKEISTGELASIDLYKNAGSQIFLTKRKDKSMTYKGSILKEFLVNNLVQ